MHGRLIQFDQKYFEAIFFYGFLLLDNYSKFFSKLWNGAKDQSHKKTMTHNKKCTRTFHTKLDNKLRSFRAMKVNWFCQKQGFYFIICLLLRTLIDFWMNDCVLTHFHVPICIQLGTFWGRIIRKCDCVILKQGRSLI